MEKVKKKFTLGLSSIIEDTEDFLKASDVIYKKMQVDENGIPQDFSFAYPYAVLSCYTIESGIKNLLIKNQILFNRKHDLLALFDLLPSHLKTEIYLSKGVFWNDGVYKETPKIIFRDLLEKK